MFVLLLLSQFFNHQKTMQRCAFALKALCHFCLRVFFPLAVFMIPKYAKNAHLNDVMLALFSEGENSNTEIYSHLMCGRPGPGSSKPLKLTLE